jgi:hypothetical protein
MVLGEFALLLDTELYGSGFGDGNPSKPKIC